MWSGTTTTHGNRKVWVELTIFFQTRTLGQFPAKYHVCCIFHSNFYVGNVVFGWSWSLKIRKDLCRVAYFCLIYIYIPLFFMKLHLWPFLLLIYFALNSSVSWIDFSFFTKRSLPYRFFLFALLRNHQILEQVETIILWKNNLRALQVDFVAFSRAIRDWSEKPCVFHVLNYTMRWESDGRKVPILWGEK